MNRLVSMGIGCASALFWVTGVHAANVHHQPSHRVHLSSTTFSLAVAGTPAKGTTFWVAHGPLAGRLGVIKLRLRGHHIYTARTSLPVDGVTTFTYLAAQGSQIVHGTLQPAGTVVVIRTIESVSAALASQRIVHWSVPLG